MQRALQHVARVGHARGAVGQGEVAEHPGGAGALAAPRQHLEGAGVGLGEHVGLVDAGEPLDDRPVEADALGEGPLELGRRDGDRLQGAEHVGEPEPDEPDVALFDGAEDELLLTVHVSILPHRCFVRVTRHGTGPRGRMPKGPRVVPGPLRGPSAGREGLGAGLVTLTVRTPPLSSVTVALTPDTGDLDRVLRRGGVVVGQRVGVVEGRHAPGTDGAHAARVLMVVVPLTVSATCLCRHVASSRLESEHRVERLAAVARARAVGVRQRVGRGRRPEGRSPTPRCWLTLLSE